MFSSFYSSKNPPPINVLPIPDDNISEDSFDNEDSDYQPDNMELDIEDSDDEVLEPEADEVGESDGTDSDLQSKMKKKETKEKISGKKVRLCITTAKIQ